MLIPPSNIMNFTRTKSAMHRKVNMQMSLWGKK